MNITEPPTKDPAMTSSLRPEVLGLTRNGFITVGGAGVGDVLPPQPVPASAPAAAVDDFTTFAVQGATGALAGGLLSAFVFEGNGWSTFLGGLLTGGHLAGFLGAYGGSRFAHSQKQVKV